MLVIKEIDGQPAIVAHHENEERPKLLKEDEFDLTTAFVFQDAPKQLSTKQTHKNKTPTPQFKK